MLSSSSSKLKKPEKIVEIQSDPGENGVKLGRPPLDLEENVIEEILGMRKIGYSLREIVKNLDRFDYRTRNGKKITLYGVRKTVSDFQGNSPQKTIENDPVRKTPVLQTDGGGQ
jgi:hypothetical protein